MAPLDTLNNLTQTSRLIGNASMFVELNQWNQDSDSTGLFLKPSLFFFYLHVHMHASVKGNVHKVRLFLPPNATKSISPFTTLYLRSLCMIPFKERFLNLYTPCHIPFRLWCMRRGHMLRNKAKIMRKS